MRAQTPRVAGLCLTLIATPRRAPRMPTGPANPESALPQSPAACHRVTLRCYPRKLGRSLLRRIPRLGAQCRKVPMIHQPLGRQLSPADPTPRFCRQPGPSGRTCTCDSQSMQPLAPRSRLEITRVGWPGPMRGYCGRRLESLRLAQSASAVTARACRRIAPCCGSISVLVTTDPQGVISSISFGAVDDRQGSLNARRTGLAMIDRTNREH